MAKRGSPVLTKHTVQRWDLDKTYLVTDTESLRGLLRIPFERARHKRALPGVAVLINELRRSAADRGSTTSVNFVTASPPQIGRAIREKLLLDGIEIDEIRFKNQMHHLMRGHFDALREHVGFKLAELLQSVRAGQRDGVELLFGDDWESDPLIYSLYADVVEGRIDWPRLEKLLERAGVQESGYLHSIRESAAPGGPRRTIDAICILRARPRASTEFEPFGPRLFWFDSYLECALILHALGYLDARGVIEVASASEANDQAVTAAFEAASSRWPRLRREHLTIVRQALVEAGLMQPVEAGSLWLRARTRWRAMRKQSPLPPLARAPQMPDYDELVQAWGHRTRKEKEVVVPYVHP
ncbi:MAG TPA: hypothetical protein VN634_17500 [Candidatus Limnocylindrales bacterium]|nr:hypothetical protein [Candidatus Limnocylindrales bacterium]